MLEEFQTTWNGHLRTIKAAKHRIEPKPPDALPINSVPDRAGLAASTFEKTEIYRILVIDVI